MAELWRRLEAVSSSPEVSAARSEAAAVVAAAVVTVVVPLNHDVLGLCLSCLL